MSRFDQYGLNTTDVTEYVPWGGIIRPHVIKQKNHSLLTVIEYKSFVLDLNENEVSGLITWQVRRGWVLWAEHQHDAQGNSRDFLCICWNPFIKKTSSVIVNAMVKNIAKNKSIPYFAKQVKQILEDLRKFTEARFVTYQDMMDVLSFSLSQGMDFQEMPPIPLYMDALLTNNLDFTFGDNDILINGKRVYAVSLFAPESVDDIYKKLVNVPFRHARRLLCFSDKEAQKDIARYTQSWFSGRKVLKNVALDGILKRYNGYYMDVFIFLLDESMSNLPDYFENQLNLMKMNYIVEDYFLKEVFWGSIPGLYWANTKPPVLGFDLLSEFLTGASVIEKTEKHDILEEAKNKLVSTPVNVNDYFTGSGGTAENFPDMSFMD